LDFFIESYFVVCEREKNKCKKNLFGLYSGYEPLRSERRFMNVATMRVAEEDDAVVFKCEDIVRYVVSEDSCSKGYICSSLCKPMVVPELIEECVSLGGSILCEDTVNERLSFDVQIVPLGIYVSEMNPNPIYYGLNAGGGDKELGNIDEKRGYDFFIGDDFSYYDALYSWTRGKDCLDYYAYMFKNRYGRFGCSLYFVLGDQLYWQVVGPVFLSIERAREFCSRIMYFRMVNELVYTIPNPVPKYNYRKWLKHVVRDRGDEDLKYFVSELPKDRENDLLRYVAKCFFEDRLYCTVAITRKDAIQMCARKCLEGLGLIKDYIYRSSDFLEELCLSRGYEGPVYKKEYVYDDSGSSFWIVKLSVEDCFVTSGRFFSRYDAIKDSEFRMFMILLKGEGEKPISRSEVEVIVNTGLVHFDALERIGGVKKTYIIKSGSKEAYNMLDIMSLFISDEGCDIVTSTGGEYRTEFNPNPGHGFNTGLYSFYDESSSNDEVS